MEVPIPSALEVRPVLPGAVEEVEEEGEGKAAAAAAAAEEEVVTEAVPHFLLQLPIHPSPSLMVLTFSLPHQVRLEGLEGRRRVEVR